MVTLYYLRRFLNFLHSILDNAEQEEIGLSNELMDYYKAVRKIFENNTHLLKANISNAERKEMLDQLGQAASEYRGHIYNQSFWGKKRTISMSGLKGFVKNITNASELNSSYVNVIYEDTNHNIWLGGNKGITMLPNTQLQTLET